MLGLPLDATLCGSFSRLSLCVSARVLEEIISISFWPAVDAGLPDWPTQYKYTMTVFILEAPLSLKLNKALKDPFPLGSRISGLRVNEKRDAYRQGPFPVSFLMIFSLGWVLPFYQERQWESVPCRCDSTNI